jgi:hypothetical protein
MITINLEFFSRETEFLEKEFEIQMPEEIVFKITETNDLNEIKCFGWDATPEIINYVKKHYPEIAKEFDDYDAQFTGA